jgi:TatD DNase family protein
MYLDIHTHNPNHNQDFAIRNLTFAEAEKTFSLDGKGFFSVGFHPWNANEFSTTTFEKLEKWVNDKRLILIGECGLDKNSKTDLNTQIEIFKSQISLSERIEKPLIIHCVGCFNELFEIKKQMRPKQLWIIHGFRGKPELAQQAMKAGCELSFGEMFNSESVRVTPIDKLFVETDESKLTIEEIYKQIAKLKKVDSNSLSAGYNLLKKMNLK